MSQIPAQSVGLKIIFAMHIIHPETKSTNISYSVILCLAHHSRHSHRSPRNKIN
jgi:hypothetical protein